MVECKSTEKWQSGQRLVIGQVSILFIDQITASTCTDGQSGWFGVDKKTCAMIVHSNNDTRVIGIGSSGLTMDQLRDRVPDIDLRLEKA